MANTHRAYSQASDDVPERTELRAKRLPLVTKAPDLVPARMINEVLYCERLMYLEWAQGEFADNAFTVEGRVAHARADKPSRPLKPVKRADDEGDEGDEVDAEPPYTARTVWLSSEALGMTAKIDVLEVDGGRVVPIEYKRGKRPDIPEGAYLPERAQVCAQVLLLREHGYECDEAQIYFARDRRRVPITIDLALEEQTREAARRAREVVERGVLPAPLDSSPKCNGCSLVGICLPDEVNLLKHAIEPAADEAIENDDVAEPTEDVAPAPRRLYPARDDCVPLYVQEQGARVGLDGDRLRVTGRSGETTEARIPNTSQVCLFGNVQLTTQALRRLIGDGIPVTYFTMGGWFVGRTVGHDSNNIELRVAQHAAAADLHHCLRLARGFVTAKILNCRTLLRRNHATPNAVTLNELRQLARKAEEATSLGSLLGIEGTAARFYFADFSGMLTPEARLDGFDLEGRNRRPPRDPLNALLSFCYSLLAKDFAVAAAGVGLDPLLGFYHQPRFGRPALALDLMEEFRPLVADSTVISAVNNRVIDGGDFIRGAPGVALKPHARKRLIQAYERRMDQLVTHPLFGYRVSYRRLLEVQARLLARHVLGELDRYPSFRTR